MSSMNDNASAGEVKPLPDWVVYSWMAGEVLLVVGGIIGAIFLTPWLGLLTLAGFALLMV